MLSVVKNEFLLDVLEMIQDDIIDPCRVIEFKLEFYRNNQEYMSEDSAEGILEASEEFLDLYKKNLNDLIIKFFEIEKRALESQSLVSKKENHNTRTTY
ncbi:hypothetical protein [Enterococcus sp. AZ192]|uniref:hypothetical protein n=1 Tax=unclassified Enterococcus TaxID=2608891 RepID=UPI003D294986